MLKPLVGNLRDSTVKIISWSLKRNIGGRNLSKRQNKLQYQLGMGQYINISPYHDTLRQ